MRRSSKWESARHVARRCRSIFEGHANAEGICPKCNRHIQLLAGGIVKLVPTRAAIILSVARRTGALPEVVDEIYSYVIDENAARISEHPILGIPELGTFQVKQPEKLSVDFKPSRRLLARIATRQPEHDHDVTRLFSGKRGFLHRQKERDVLHQHITIREPLHLELCTRSSHYCRSTGHIDGPGARRRPGRIVAPENTGAGRRCSDSGCIRLMVNGQCQQSKTSRYRHWAESGKI